MTMNLECKNLVHQSLEKVSEAKHKIESLQFLRSRHRRGNSQTVLTNIFDANDET